MTRRRTSRAYTARPLESLETRSLLSMGHLGGMAGASPDIRIPGGWHTVYDWRGVDSDHHHAPVENVSVHGNEDPGEVMARKQLEANARAEADAYIMHQHEHTAHTGDMVKQHEHEALLDLVPFESATDIAILDGDWTDPKTWMGSRVPGRDARVWIMPGRTVTVDTVLAEPAATIRVSGTLRFAPDRDTALAVDTLVVNPDGMFVMGTEHEPIAPEHTARLIFTGTGPIDATVDPMQLGRGLISHGSAMIHGAEVTSWLTLAQPARAGQTTLVLTAEPVGWKAGDILALAGSNLGQHERLTVASIEGRTVRLTSALRFTHSASTAEELAARYGEAPSRGSLEVHVANLTRNARFESANPGEIATRGHVMFMHSPHVEVANAGFYDLGRTDKSRPVGDDNPRGRYALHFHRTGSESVAIPVSGVAVDGSPGWGVVNHSSHVDVSESVTYGVVGAGFVTEAGDERGSFRDSLAVWSPGSSNDHPDNYVARRPINDFGFNGHGFWLQSPTVAMTGNVVSGAASYGIVYYPSFYEGAPNGIDRLTIAENRDNTIYAGRRGLRIYGSAPTEAPSRIEGLTAWNLGYDAFGLDYSRNIELVGSTLIGKSSVSAVFLDSGPLVSFRDNYVVGYRTGLEAGHGGRNEITGGYLNNTVDLHIRKNVHITNAWMGVREVRIEGVRFVGGGISMVGSLANDADVATNHAAWTQFSPELITWDGRQLYYADQSATQVMRTPIPEFNGKSNAELMAQFGLAYAGAVAPPEATPAAKLTGGLIGPRIGVGVIPLNWVASYPKPDGRVDIVLRDPDTRSAVVVKVFARDLRDGWNVVWATDSAGVRRPGFLFFRK